MSTHDCIQTRRLFIIERDASTEVAKHQQDIQQIRDLLSQISREIAETGHNVTRELKAVKQEISGLSKIIKRHG